MKNVIFIAPPAAGKGTISDYLVEKFGYKHISTGDLLRGVSKSGSELGRKIAELMKTGEFIGDDIILPLFKEELEKYNGKLVILDGIPRNINQAKYIDSLFDVDNYLVINIVIDEDLLEKRATGRRLCNNCKASYNVYFEGFKPKVENVCDKCNNELIIRDDDKLETFKNRYKIYKNETAPLIDYYKEKGILKEVDASKSSEEILSDVVSILNGEDID